MSPFIFCGSPLRNTYLKVSEHDQDIPQSHTADQPTNILLSLHISISFYKKLCSEKPIQQVYNKILIGSTFF